MNEEVKKAQEGVCPICGSCNVDYDIMEYQGDYVEFPCKCRDCHATWIETYDLVFAEQQDVEAGNDYKN